MKQFKSLQFLSVWLIFSLLFQTMAIPLLQAQGRGIFIREDNNNGDEDDSGNSFRTERPAYNGSSSRSQTDVGGLGNKNPGADALGASQGLSGLSSPQGVGGMGGITSLGSSGGGIIYQIHVLGEVFKPGTYRIPASTRVSEVLLMAGGIRKHGSERNIEIRRPGGATRKIDLLGYKIFGQLQDNPYLMDNEVVFVPIKKNVVEIEGAVLRPGTYELRNEKTLQDIIRLSGGFAQGVALKEAVKVVRYDENENKEVLDVANTPQDLSAFRLESGDVVIIPHILTAKNTFDYNIRKFPNDTLFYPSYEDRIFVIGAVEVPGAYNFNQYYKLSNYLALAGGTTRMAKGYIKIITPDGVEKKVKPDARELINPGDTVYVPEKFFSRETWVSVVTSLISLGLSATTTAIVIRNR